MMGILRKHTSLGALHMGVAAFVVGAAVMTIEITASRVLAPFFGTSILVWTSLIVTILLGLSLGYWYGGKLAAKTGDPARSLGNIMALASIVVLLGLWMVGGFSESISGLFFGFTAATLFLFLGSLLVSFVVFAVPVFLLAMAGPIIVKEWTKVGDRDVGVSAGQYFAVSTLGSVVGTVLPTLVLVPSIGTKATVAITSIIIAAVGLPLTTNKVRFVSVVALLYCILMLAIQTSPTDRNVIYRTETPYQLLRVMEGDDGLTQVRGDAVVMSLHAPDGGRTYAYYDFLGLTPLWHGDDPEGGFGIIGYASGSIARQFRNVAPQTDSLGITGVEIDEEMVAIGERFFGTDELDVETVIADGRMFLRSDDRVFSSMAFDAFSSVYIPPHMVTREFFTLVHERLTTDGVISLNVIASDPDAMQLRLIGNTLASVFENVLVVPVGGSSWNYVVYASDADLEPNALADRLPDGYQDIQNALRYTTYRIVYDPAALVLTDDYAPTEFMTDSMAVAQAFR